MRAVLDPNVIISGVLSPEGSPARVLAAWRAGGFEVIASPRLIDELRRALAYPKLRSRIAEADAERLVSWVYETATRGADPDPHPSIRSSDPGDDYLIALAAGHNAALVSGDRHLLELQGRIPVYAATEFLELVEGQGG